MNTKSKTLIGGLIFAAGVVMIPAPAADASPACAHRGASHYDQHGGKDADSAWHVAHGGLPTCDQDKKSDDHREDDDNPGVWRRDHEGYHCTLLHGCG